MDYITDEELAELEARWPDKSTVLGRVIASLRNSRNLADTLGRQLAAAAAEVEELRDQLVAAVDVISAREDVIRTDGVHLDPDTFEPLTDKAWIRTWQGVAFKLAAALRAAETADQPPNGTK